MSCEAEVGRVLRLVHVRTLGVVDAARSHSKRETSSELALTPIAARGRPHLYLTLTRRARFAGTGSTPPFCCGGSPSSWLLASWLLISMGAGELQAARAACTTVSEDCALADLARRAGALSGYVPAH